FSYPTLFRSVGLSRWCSLSSPEALRGRGASTYICWRATLLVHGTGGSDGVDGPVNAEKAVQQDRHRKGNTSVLRAARVTRRPRPPRSPGRLVCHTRPSSAVFPPRRRSCRVMSTNRCWRN